MPALRLDAALIHVNRADASGSGQILGPDPFFDELFLGAADRRFVTTERLVDTDQFAVGGAAPDHVHQPAADRRGGRDPGRGPLHRLCPRLRPGRGVPEGVRGRGRRPRRLGGLRRALPRRRRGRLPAAVGQAGADAPGQRRRGGRHAGRAGEHAGIGRRAAGGSGVTRAEYCAIACAEVFRGDGEVMASAFGTAPALGARLARLTFAPDLVLTDGDAALVAGAPALGADRHRPWCSSRTCPTGGCSTWCGRDGAT